MKKGRKLSSAAEIVEPIPEIKREKLTPGVYVRSQKLPIVKPTMQQKVIKVLEELGIGNCGWIIQHKRAYVFYRTKTDYADSTSVS